MRSVPRLADLDRDYVWSYRVIGYSSGGSVTGSESVECDHDLEAAHDRVMSLPGTRQAETMGPFRSRKVQP